MSVSVSVSVLFVPVLVIQKKRKDTMRTTLRINGTTYIGNNLLQGHNFVLVTGTLQKLLQIKPHLLPAQHKGQLPTS